MCTSTNYVLNNYILFCFFVLGTIIITLLHNVFYFRSLLALWHDLKKRDKTLVARVLKLRSDVVEKRA